MSSSLWRSVEQLADGAVLYEWRASLGNSNKAALSLLAPTNTVAESFPCRGRFPCGCRHRVIPNIRGGTLAVCDCEQSGCPSIALETKDVMVHALDRGKFGRAISVAAGFETVPYEDKVRRWTRIGRIRKPAANVYWSAAGDERGLLVVIEELSRNGEPFLLLTPTKRLHTDAVEALVARSASVIAAAEDWFRLNEAGTFSCPGAIDDLVAELAQRITRKPATAEVLERMDTRIESIRGEHQELKDENAELKRLQADGYFKFAEKVAPDDFLAFAFIMAYGNRKAAAGRLEIPHRTFYDRVERWAKMDREHQRMYRLVEWRKKVGRKGKVSLPETVMSGDSGDQAENPETIKQAMDALRANSAEGDHSQLLGDILQALQRQNATNWKAVREELVGILMEEVPQ